MNNKYNRSWYSWKILLLRVIERNALLFERPGHFAMVTTIRIVALLSVVVAIKMLINWEGSVPIALDVPFVTSLLLALFAIALSWAFFHSAQVASDATTNQLIQFLGDMRSETRNLLSNNMPDNIERLYKNAKENPSNETAKYELVDSLIDGKTRQLLILMSYINGKIQGNTTMNFKFRTNSEHVSGTINTDYLKRSLQGTDFIEMELPDSIKLTDAGLGFVQWLKDSGKEAIGFASDIGDFGDTSKIESI